MRASAFITDNTCACPFHWQVACTVHDTRVVLLFTITRTFRLSMLHGLRSSRLPVTSQALLALITHIMYSFHYALGPACRGSVSLYVPPLNYKREGTQCYRGTDSQAHTQYNIHTMEVGYYAPVTWTTLIPRVLVCSSQTHLTGKTLRPPPHLRISAGAFHHPAGGFSLRQIYTSRWGGWTGLLQSSPLHTQEWVLMGLLIHPFVTREA
jgi:hypothetical protein